MSQHVVPPGTAAPGAAQGNAASAPPAWAVASYHPGAGAPPPYALAPVHFLFPALAACAGRVTAVGDRELVLGALMAARLAVATAAWVGVAATRITAHDRAVRAERARQWLALLPMPQPARLAFYRAFDATVAGPVPAGEALTELARTLTGHLDATAQRELVACAERLRLYYEQTTP